MNHENLLKKLEEYHQKTDDNVVGVGYGYKTINGIITDNMSVIFTVKEKLPKSQLKNENILPKEININDEIIVTDVIQGEIKLLCDPTFYNWQTTPPSNQNSFRPLKGGISCSNLTSKPNSIGTLGFFAIDNDTNSLVGVSNNHVLIDDAFLCSERNPLELITNVKDDIVSQPYEDFPIGSIKKYYPMQLPPVYNYVDVGITTIYSGTTFINSGISYNQEGLTPSIYPFATTEEINNLLVTGSTSYNPILYSAGRTTGAKGEGVTKLLVNQFPVAVSVGFVKQGISGVTVYFSDLISFVATTGTTQPIEFMCNYPIAPGDSGSALIADISGIKKIIGLCFAGNTTTGFACRIDHVANLMNISAWNGEPVNFSDSSNILEYTVSGLSDQIYIDHEGKRYWQVGLRNVV